jgi:hypothetical protein
MTARASTRGLDDPPFIDLLVKVRIDDRSTRDIRVKQVFRIGQRGLHIIYNARFLTRPQM